jgi:hypothetical protein
VDLAPIWLPGLAVSLMVDRRRCLAVLLRPAYLAVTNAVAVLRLLPKSDPAKDAEILALRRQITVLERQLHGTNVRFATADRAFLAALLTRLPRDVLARSGCWCAPRRFCAGTAT